MDKQGAGEIIQSLTFDNFRVLSMKFDKVERLEWMRKASIHETTRIQSTEGHPSVLTMS